MRQTFVAVVVLCCSLNGFAATGFGQLVKAIEHRYSVRHHGVPGLWLAKPFLIGSGVGGLRIANFNNFHIPAADMDQARQQMREVLGPEWQPFVEVFSKHDGEWTAIYIQTSGKTMELLIAADDDNNFTVVQMKLSERAMREWMDEPVKHAKHSAIRTNRDNNEDER